MYLKQITVEIILRNIYYRFYLAETRTGFSSSKQAYHEPQYDVIKVANILVSRHSLLLQAALLGLL